MVYICIISLFFGLPGKFCLADLASGRFPYTSPPKNHIQKSLLCFGPSGQSLGKVRLHRSPPCCTPAGNGAEGTGRPQRWGLCDLDVGLSGSWGRLNIFPQVWGIDPARSSGKRSHLGWQKRQGEMSQKANGLWSKLMNDIGVNKDGYVSSTKFLWAVGQH